MSRIFIVDDHPLMREGVAFALENERGLTVCGREKSTSPLDRLSDRDPEVFETIGCGLGTDDIAHRMHISPKTVQSYQSRIKTKLNLNNSRELMRRAVQWVEVE